tara:strand:- start:623 stop:1033 length:411 start_codon:yes stop_codon:yes gene_type:complete
MIEEFNGVIYLGLYLIILIGTAYYTYSTVFQTDKFLEKYGIDQSGAFMIRFAGTFLVPMVLLMVYMLLTGISGNWIIFVYGFLQAVTATIVGYWTVEKSHYKTITGEKVSSEGYLAPLGFTFAWGVVIYGTSAVIY